MRLLLVTVVAAATLGLSLAARAQTAAPAAPDSAPAKPAAAPSPVDAGHPVDPPMDPAAEPAPPPPPDPFDPSLAPNGAPRGPGAVPAPTDAGERAELDGAIFIEDIRIVGNGSTRSELILRALPFAAGDILAVSDPKLAKAQFKVLSLGFFRSVAMSMQRGSSRGRVVIVIRVEERGTVVLNRLWFGSSTLAPWWIGADVTERNLFGTGLMLGGGLLYASHEDVTGSDDQWAGELRFALPAIAGPRWSAFASLTGARGSEAYRIRGDSSNTGAASHRAFLYRRYTARAGITRDLTSLSRLSGGARAELIDADRPVAPIRLEHDGQISAVDLHLDRGKSRVMSVAVTYDRDTRPDPVLPHAGSRLTLSAELSGAMLGSSYDFATLLARYERWWPLRVPGHAIGIHLAGGIVLGDAPRFDQLHIADVNHMLSQRALGLLVSANAPLDVLGTAPDKPPLGELGGAATVEYAYRLFGGLFGNRSRRIYGGDLFVGLGLWGLSETASPRTRDTSLWNALPIDLFVDAGLRIDTDIGVFELTVANALGRLPR